MGIGENNLSNIEQMKGMREERRENVEWGYSVTYGLGHEHDFVEAPAKAGLQSR